MNSNKRKRKKKRRKRIQQTDQLKRENNKQAFINRVSIERNIKKQNDKDV